MMNFNMMLTTIFFLIGFLPAATASSNFSFERETIMTVCDVNRITINSKGEPIAHCDELPPPGDFFDVSSRTVWEMPCDDTSNDEPLARRPTIWDRSIRALHWLLEGVQDKIRSLGTVLLLAVEDVSRLSLITRRWNVYWFLVGSLAASLLFFIQGLYTSRAGKLSYNIILNVFMGFGGSAAFYMVHLYFENLYVMAVFVVIGIFTLTPWYPELKLSAVGVLTSMELIIPLFGFCVMHIFETQLFFGPILSLYINCGSIVIHIICLMGLYIDEKLILVKVFLLPFYRMFQKVFGLSDRNQNEINFMKASAQELNREIFGTFGELPPEPTSTLEQLDKAFTDLLQKACKIRQGEWRDQCNDFIHYTCLDQAYNLGSTAFFFEAVFSICWKTAYHSCRSLNSIDLDQFCIAPESTAFGKAYAHYQEALETLAREIVIDPLSPKVNNDLLEMTASFDLFAAKWTWWLRHCISWGLAGLCISIVLLSLIYAIVFLVKYRRNLYFCNNYLSRAIMERWDIKLTRRERSRYYSTFTRVMSDYVFVMYNYPSRFAESLRLIGKVMFCFWFEQSAKYLHHLLMNIQFVVPNYGSARFVFNVQGDGMFAFLMRAVLGGFSLESKYCKIADSSVCNTAFIPVEWRTWLQLFLLAFFYFMIGLYQSKSDYIMCRICDFLIPEQGEKRTEVTLEEIVEERRKRGVVVMALAEEEINHPCFDHEQNESVIAFYQPRRWYHRFMPTLVLSTIAYWKFGVDSILCQICGQDIITSRYGCKTLLFCEECHCNLTHCPCGSEDCQDLQKFPV